MKTVLKRLLSFVLVAMMLVSVMPFQASADTTYPVNVKIAGEYVGQGSVTAAGEPTYTAIVEAAVNVINAAGRTDYDVDSKVVQCFAGSDYKGELSSAGSVPSGTDVFTVLYDSNAWNYTITDGTKTIKTDKCIKSEVDAVTDAGTATAFINGKLGDKAGFYKYKSHASDATNKTFTLTVEPNECAIQFEIKVNGTAMSGVSTVTKKYNESYTLNVSNWFKEDPKLYTIGSWDINGQTIADGSAWTVNTVGSVTAKIEINSNGKQRSNLWSKNSAGVRVPEGYLYWKSGEAIEGWKAAPSVGTTTGFTRWNSQQDGKGVNLPGGNLGATEILLNDYYAQYETNYNNGNAEVRVTAVYFVDGIEHHRSSQYVLTLEVPAGTNVMTAEWLNSAGNKQAIERGIADNARNIDSYTWDGGFYNSSFSTSYASTGLKANGNTNVYVKVNADKSELEDVYLYIHKNTTSKDPAQIVSMKGYVGDDYVTLADAKEVAKKNDWRADSYKIYSDNDWKQLVAGGNPDGNGEEVRVNDGTNTIVHILLKNGYKTSGTADNSNYKTGDTIMIAVTALGLSASALVVLYLVNKKKRAL